MNGRNINEAIAAAARAINGSTISEAAAAFVAAHADDPDLQTWMRDEVINIVHERMRAVIRSDRGRAMHAARTTGRWAAYASGDEPGLYKSIYAVDSANTRVQLGDMRRPDLLYAAQWRDDQSNSLRFEAAFLRAVAKRVGTKSVREALSEKQLTAMREQHTGTAA